MTAIKTKINYKDNTAENNIELAVLKCFKNMNLKDSDVSVTCSEDYKTVQIKFRNSYRDMYFECKYFEPMSRNGHYTYICRAYEIVTDKILVKHDAYTFERLGSNHGYYELKLNEYVLKDDTDNSNPYTFNKLEYEYIFREHETSEL